MIPRLVATDLDGTLYRSDSTISGRTRAALRLVRESGSALVVVTGRPPRWLGKVAEDTGHAGLAICANGAYLYDLADERVVEERLLAPADALACIRRLAEAIPGVAFAAEHGHRFVREEAYRARWPAPDITVVTNAEELCERPIAKLLVRHEGLDADALLAAASEIAGDLATLTHSSRDGLLEVSAAGVTKATALAALADELGVDPQEAVAFGDMPNDLPMLAWAGHSVAVENAHPDVLQAVDEVTAPNDEDGVALVLERLFAAVSGSGVG